ncbi:formyltransferase family protein [Candidatus Pelagibacter sp.]|jgi:methionyl-tRNA formyltransferase|nr:formyltransferase family protein [Candidatus Pelagibacter sp.]|tara:strand:- start:81 stop:869 length:789 start_codon:yes stop_codon:yes gene_type:complete
MKITLFTSNKSRHNYLINLLSKFCDELFVVQECGTIHPGEVPGHYPASKNMKNYFKEVYKAENKLFGNSFIKNYQKKINILPILFGDLNKCSISFLSNFLKSDIYIVFGSSYIKGELVDFLVKKKTINIHMGVSPYYRGTDCNFWALHDNNPHLVGATIHMLTKGLDSGPILYHAMSKIKPNPFEYTMSAVKSAFHSISERIVDSSIFDIEPIEQNKSQLIRYSKKDEFTENIVSEYLKKNINLNLTNFNNELLKDVYYLDL